MTKIDRRIDIDERHIRTNFVPSLETDDYLLARDFRVFRNIESAVKWKKILEKRSKIMTDWLKKVSGVIHDSGTNEQKREMLQGLLATHIEELNHINWSRMYVEGWLMHEVEFVRTRTRN